MHSQQGVGERRSFTSSTGLGIFTVDPTFSVGQFNVDRQTRRTVRHDTYPAAYLR